jgi:hypothetical protein
MMKPIGKPLEMKNGEIMIPRISVVGNKMIFSEYVD